MQGVCVHVCVFKRVFVCVHIVYTNISCVLVPLHSFGELVLPISYRCCATFVHMFACMYYNIQMFLCRTEPVGIGAVVLRRDLKLCVCLYVFVRVCLTRS